MHNVLLRCFLLLIFSVAAAAAQCNNPTMGNVVGGDCAGPLGGKGGNLNQSAAGYAATSPGGGGGANSAGSLVAQAGAAGGVRIRW